MEGHNLVKINKKKNIDKDPIYLKANNNNYQTIKIQLLFEMGWTKIY